jgi:hypothetical protein
MGLAGFETGVGPGWDGDRAGLGSATELLHRAHTTAAAVSLDRPDHTDSPTADHQQLPGQAKSPH